MTPHEIQRVFRAVPGHFLILAADAAFTIVGASEGYLRISHTDASISGRRLFDVFPDKPDDPEASGVANLTRDRRSRGIQPRLRTV